LHQGIWNKPPGPGRTISRDPANGVRPLSVQFTDLSSNSPTSWQWNFGDDTANSTVQNPVHTYTAAGTYTVTLTATNAFGSNTTRKSNYITVTPPPPFLDGWSYRKLHTISGSSSLLTDYQIRFKVWNTTGTDSGENVYLGNNVQPDFRDIRFTTTDNTVLPYWVQETGANYAVVWVKVPSIPVTGTQLYLYYGNPSATSQSNGDATFLFFEDFDGTTLNATRWGSSGSVSFSTGVVTLNRQGTDARLYTKNQIYTSKPTITEVKYQHPSRFRNRLYLTTSENGGAPTEYDYGIFNPSVYWNGFTGGNLNANTWYIVRWVDTDSDYTWSVLTGSDTVIFTRNHGSSIANTGYLTFAGTK